MVTRLGGDEALARQLATLFIEECPRMLERVHTSVSSGTPDDVRRAAHAFKGSVSNFIEQGPAVTAFELECAGRDGGLEGAPALVVRLDGEVEALLVELRRFAEGQ